MKKTLTLLVLCAMANTLLAQHITHHFHDVSMTEALQYIQSQTQRYDINFIANELEDFRVTTDVKNKSVTDAILQVTGLYPIRVVRNDERKIYVECTHKTDRHLTGRLVDEDNSPVAFANIALLSPIDSTLLGGGVSNENGDFVIPYERPTVLARISFVGYKTVWRLCSTEHIGTIRMQPEAYTIKGVVVKGEIPQYQMTAGGITVDVEHSILHDVGTADNLLSMLPNVQGEDGNFTVFAKGTPEIYINNKKVRDAKELKQLKATDIKSVDIITSPGAKYNAEVNAVIRIKTIRQQGDGLSVEAYSQVNYNDWWTNYDDVTVKYRTGGLEVFATGTFYNGHYGEDPALSTDLTIGSDHIHIDQGAPNSMWFTTMSGKVGMSYDLDDNNSVGLTYEHETNPYTGGDMEGTQTIYRNSTQEGTVSQRMHVSEFEPSHDANIYYVGKVGKLGIDFNGSYIWRKTRRTDAETERNTELDDRDITTVNNNRRQMLAAKLVLSYPIWKGALSVGSEATSTHSRGTSETKEGWVPSSDTRIRENNLAGFAEYEVQLGHWSLGAGLRYEHVSTDYESFGVYQPEPSRTYNDLFPNLSAGWQKGKWGLQLSYNKRIQRPNYYSLNNRVQYDNRYQVEGGNPMLRPAIRQGLDFSATYAWLSFEAGYTHYTDQMLNFSSVYQEGKDIIMWRNENFPKFESYHASLVASPKWGIYTPTLTLSYYQQHFDVTRYGVSQSLGKPEWSANLRNWLTLGKTMKAMVNIHYATSYDYGFSHIAHQFNVNARLQKTILKEQLTASIFANDIFRTLRDKWAGYYPVEVLTRDAYQHSQQIGLSLSYNFNTSRSKYKGTGAGNEEKSRL